MIFPPSIDPYSWTIGSIASLLLQVNNGAKPVASIQTHNLFLQDCIEEIKNAGLLYKSETNGKTHTTLYIFKDSIYEHIISYLIGTPYNKNILLIWVQGKMFGYSDKSISEFIMDISNEKVNTKVI